MGIMRMITGVIYDSGEEMAADVEKEKAYASAMGICWGELSKSDRKKALVWVPVKEKTDKDNVKSGALAPDKIKTNKCTKDAN